MNRQAQRCKPCRGQQQSRDAGVEKDSLMLAAHVAGETLEQIGSRFGVSKQRVSARIARAVSRLDENERRFLYGDR